MWPTLALNTSRTSYRGVKGSGAGQSWKTSARSSTASRPTQLAAVLSGQTFKRSQRGLYDGALPQSGNSIPKSRHKTSRNWRPNVQRKRLWSDILQDDVKVKVSTRAMRTIAKMGGLDAYLAKRDDGRLGELGRSLRNQIGMLVRVAQDEKIELEGQAQSADVPRSLERDGVQSEVDRLRLEMENKATMQDRVQEAASEAQSGIGTSEGQQKEEQHR